MFDIITSRDFLAKLEADYTDFKAQSDSARHALNCLTTAYHLHEWVWGDWLKTDYATWNMLGIRDEASFKKWLDDAWPGFALVQSLANGAKHFARRITVEAKRVETERIAGYGSGPYGVGPYGQPYLLIDYGAATPERWQTAEQVIDDAVAFWRGFFETYRPEAPPF
jgi:hypothetical protein